MPSSVSLVEASALDLVWPQIESKIDKALRHGAGDSLSKQSLRDSIKSGTMQLWAIHDGPEVSAAVIMQVLERDKGKALFIVLVAGHGWKKSAKHVNSLVRKYANEIGAYTIEATCRPGMAQWLGDLGWKQKAILMEMDNG